MRRGMRAPSGAMYGSDGKRGAHMVGDRLGVGAVGLREDEHEFVPAEAGYEVGVAAPAAEDFGYPLDDLVAERMAVRVVEELEVVDVRDQHRELALIALCPPDLHLELLERPPPVEQSAERIDLAESLDLFHQPRVLERLGHLAGEQQDRGPSVGRELAGGPRRRYRQTERGIVGDRAGQGLATRSLPGRAAGRGRASAARLGVRAAE